MKKCTARLLAFTCILACLPAMSFGQGHVDDSDNKDKPAPEFDWQLPAVPLTENLVPFYVSRTTRQSFSIDAKSLSVDSDGVIRYTVIGTSASGAKNISFEGIRCTTNEKRIYALGHADGTWGRARNSVWEHIEEKGANLQHAELAQTYFCSSGLVAGTANQILNSMRYHRS